MQIFRFTRRRSYRRKYHFHDLRVGKRKLIEGSYRLIRIACNTWGKDNGRKFLVIQTNNGAIVERFK